MTCESVGAVRLAATYPIKKCVLVGWVFCTLVWGVFGASYLSHLPAVVVQSFEIDFHIILQIF